ncbi:hypothetical protein L1987_46513 [Smallanthus sonchifolius]|uniref:Uncharacterized protein n=1 Tax=Smallanthus sonchifolius TaxID=185202 RepID=A0ACB9FZD4_9ASTR|nr:hypothetical protein L1987_46513 [Smallanthus sonchifolius]
MEFVEGRQGQNCLPLTAQKKSCYPPLPLSSRLPPYSAGLLLCSAILHRISNSSHGFDCSDHSSPSEGAEIDGLPNLHLRALTVLSSGSASGDESVDSIPVKPVDQDEHDLLEVENGKLLWRREVNESHVANAKLGIKSLKRKLKAPGVGVECARIVRELKDTRAIVRYMKER